MDLKELQQHIDKMFDSFSSQTIGQAKSVTVELLSSVVNGPEFHYPEYRVTIEFETAKHLEGLL